MRPATPTPRKSEEPYLLGTDPEEGKRLQTQHRLWAEAAHDLWDRAGFGKGARLLDLGCGPGFAALELAARVGPEGRVLAVDASRRFIAFLVREADRLGIKQLTARVERVQELQLEPASLDGVFARWIFCFLPDPAPGHRPGRVRTASRRPPGDLGLSELQRHHSPSAEPGVRSGAGGGQ